ncbi:MAG TPA: hypothetical protein VHB20_07045 [Verrucomicrobiae bacterium]|jgi:hypothetical protein|nr:hypothetical protein [Verrucomicrobiae bacterium]
MNEIDPLESQLQSWIPRRPSPEIEARLFGASRRRAAWPSHVWTWLTPAFACALTLLVAVTGSNRHGADFEGRSPSAVASLMYDPEASNTPRTFTLSRTAGKIWFPQPLLDPARFPGGRTNL